MDLDHINIIPSEISQIKSNTYMGNPSSSHGLCSWWSVLCPASFIQATCFFTEREVRNVTSVLVDWLSGWGVGWGRRWGKIREKAKGCKNWFSLFSCFFLYKYSGHQHHWAQVAHKEMHAIGFSGTSPSHPACNLRSQALSLGSSEFPKAHPSRRLPAVQPHHTGWVSLVSTVRRLTLLPILCVTITGKYGATSIRERRANHGKKQWKH